MIEKAKSEMEHEIKMKQIGLMTETAKKQLREKQMKTTEDR